MKNAKSSELSGSFYVMRGFAIISVAYAHSLSLDNDVLQRLGEIIGLFGVPVFLFCSGFWFKHDKTHTLSSKLLKNIISPWIVWGSVGYFVSYFLGVTTISLKDYFSFLSGHGTWLYYIPVYLIIRILFNYLKLNSIPILMIMLLSIVMNIITYSLPNAMLFINDVCTPWQNPLNWICYFAFGMICRRHEAVFTRMTKFKGSQGILIITLFCLLVLTLLITKDKVNYWNPIAIPLQYVSILLIFNLSTLICKNKFLQILGQNSLLLYLIHIQFGIALTNRFFGLIDLPEIAIFLMKPLSVLIITMGAIYIMYFILTQLKLAAIQPYLGVAVKQA